MHLTRIGEAFQMLQSAGLNSGAEHPRRSGVDNDEQNFHDCSVANNRATGKAELERAGRLRT